MGQQQLLLIVLGIIIVSIALFAGINLFRSNAVESKRNNVINELVNLASMAQQFYLKPVSYGGGGRKFIGWYIPSQLTTTSNGHYTASVSNDNVVIIGVGNEVVTNNDSVRVQINIDANSFSTSILN